MESSYFRVKGKDVEANLNWEIIYDTQVIRISNGKANAPALWIDGGIHAREWISPAAVTYIINHLVENSEDLEADYYILPVANPDGYIFLPVPQRQRVRRGC